jgi:N-acetylmuramoyl-L-alanine amidase
MLNRFVGLLVIILFAGAFSCSRQPFYQSNKIYKKQAKLYTKEIRRTPALFTTAEGHQLYWIGTVNFNLRKPNFVIIHYTAQNSCEQTLKTFTVSRTNVSAHYVICKDGAVHHMLSDYLRAWQAGVAKWGNLTDVNSASVGIEIDNSGFEAYTQPQINSLLQLLDTLKTKYAIPAANFIGHSDIAPVRKVDPGIFFPWKTLADSGYGLWYGDTTNVIVPDSFNNVQALRIIGYDVRDSLAAIKAFKTHFLQDTSYILNDADKKILYELEKRSM